MAQGKWLEIKFWHVMVGTGLFLMVVGLLLILIPNGVGQSGTIVLELFGASFEGSEMGLALMVLAVACFLIAQKDRADMQRYQSMREDLTKTSKITAKLVADNVEQSMQNVPGDAREWLREKALDWEEYDSELQSIRNWEDESFAESHAIRHAERGMELLEALEREGYSFKQR